MNLPHLNKIHQGDVLDVLRSWPDGFVQCVVTSPPYWGLRDYGVEGQIGLEKTPEAYVEKMVEVFREVRRVLRDDGTLWLNLGDSYIATGTGSVSNKSTITGGHKNQDQASKRPCKDAPGLKPKDLVGIPWRVALALQADGWYLRQEVIWNKRNCMPESVQDRPTRNHEQIFLMTKSPRYFYDAEAIKERCSESFLNDTRHQSGPTTNKDRDAYLAAGAQDPKGPHRLFGKKARSIRPGVDTRGGGQGNGEMTYPLDCRNKRSVWTMATVPFPEAHFATFPPEIPETCISAGTSERGACTLCRKPWDRLTDKTRHFESGSGRSGRDPVGKNGHGVQGGGKTGDVRKGPVTTTTTGWRAGCACEEAPYRAPSSPCVVLDPFMGAGTTGLVAAKLNRYFLGIELNVEYIKIAERRIKPELEQMKNGL